MIFYKGITTQDVAALCKSHDRLAAEKKKLREALEEITKKEGRFSMDPLEHARNCVDDMAEIAQAALRDTQEES
jgi:ElaB/YqjD/DUF883 family membrane-anchored ribosome-binding protein